MSWFSALVWLLTLSGCQSQPENTPADSDQFADRGTSHWINIRRSQPIMGTFVFISAWGQNEDHLQRAITRAFQEIHRIDSLMSLHQPESELSLLNQNAAREFQPVSSELFHVVATAQKIALATDGAFDITIRPLADLWGFIWKEYRLPTSKELASVLPRVNWRQVELDADTPAIRFRSPDVSIDLGGVGKGFAVDQAVRVLEREGISRALVRAGGDVRVTGPPPDQNDWEIQLEDPSKRGDRTLIRLTHRAISTSGHYENFFEIDGQRYSHLLNPKTGLPVQGVASCSLTADTCLESDAWATACFVLGPELSLSRFGNRFGMRFLVPDASDPQGWSVLSSPTFPESISHD